MSIRSGKPIPNKPLTCCGTFMMRSGENHKCIRCGKEIRTIASADENAACTYEPTRRRVLCVIPARLESTRLPGKVLLDETGKPLIQYAWENAKAARLIDDVAFAVPSNCFELQEPIRAFGARFSATSDFACGTDRVASLLQRPAYQDFDIILNLQADEPEITGEDLDQLIESLIKRPEIDMATMAWKTNCASPVADSRDNVKVAFSYGTRTIRPLYFSRSQIPQTSPWWIHAGVYAFRRDFLLRFAETPQSPLEIAERLEQLRALEMGAKIHVEKLSHPVRGINTPGDYWAFVKSQAEKIPVA